MSPPAPEDWAISAAPDGTRRAVGRISLTVLPDGPSALFKRNAVRGLGGAAPQHRRALVGELNGVRVYVTGESLVLTTRNLRL